MEQTGDGETLAVFLLVSKHLHRTSSLPCNGYNQKYRSLFLPGMYSAKQHVAVESSEFREAAGKLNTNVGW